MMQRFFQQTRQPIPPLVQSIEEARQEWKFAQELFRTVPVDCDLIDYAIYMMQATEKRYMFLLKQAKQEGVRCDTVQLAQS